MPVGIGELLLVAVLLLVAFGPRKRQEAFSLARWSVRAAAVVAPSALLLDRVGASFGLVPLHRLALVAASVVATAVSVALLAAQDRMRDRASHRPAPPRK